MDKELQDIIEKAKGQKLEDVSLQASTALTEAQCTAVIKALADSFGLQSAIAFIAIALLMLKGACNAQAPNSMSVQLKDHEGKILTVTKEDILHAMYGALKHKFIRRLAEALAIPICTYAQDNKIIGDLAGILNNLAMGEEGGTPLNTKERAWACSFCQSLPDLDKLAGPRIPRLLAIDYTRRFLKKKSKQKSKTITSPNSPPAPKRKGGKQNTQSQPGNTGGPKGQRK